MKPDDDNRRIIAEQWWPALFLLVFWVVAGIVLAQNCHGQTAKAKIAWDPQAPVIFFKVWRGIDLLTTTEPGVSTATFELPIHQISTLTVTAHTETKSSGPSQPFIAVPIIPQWSHDLKVWVAEPSKTFFVEHKPRFFFRAAFPTQ
jgi:hypothetical protein